MDWFRPVMREFLPVAVLFLMLAGCGDAASIRVDPTPESPLISTATPPDVPPVPASTLTPTSLPQEWLLWQGSPHAGRNVTCETCHGKKETGLLLTPASQNISGNIDPRARDDSALCAMCHPDADINRNPVDSVHANFKCVDCHDPHGAAASCMNAGCHENIRKLEDYPPATPTGGHPKIGSPFCGGPNCHPAATQAALSNPTIHGPSHSMIACNACHESGDLHVGPSGMDGIWIPFQTVEMNGSSVTRPFSPHNIQRKVDCVRCHFEGNTWNLPLVSGAEFNP